MKFSRNSIQCKDFIDKSFDPKWLSLLESRPDLISSLKKKLSGEAEWLYIPLELLLTRKEINSSTPGNQCIQVLTFGTPTANLRKKNSPSNGRLALFRVSGHVDAIHAWIIVLECETRGLLSLILTRRTDVPVKVIRATWWRTQRLSFWIIFFLFEKFYPLLLQSEKMHRRKLRFVSQILDLHSFKDHKILWISSVF